MAGTTAVSAQLAAFANGLDEADSRPVTMAELAEGLGETAPAVLLLLLALPPLIPLPGVPIGFVFGMAIGTVALQVIAGRTVLVLPGALARRSLPRAGVRRMLLRAVPWLRRIETLLRPGRMMGLTIGGPRRAVGVIAVLLALTLAVPIPMGDPLPALATMTLAFGLMEHDGAAVLAGTAIAVTAMAWNIFLIATSLHLLDMAAAHLF